MKLTKKLSAAAAICVLALGLAACSTSTEAADLNELVNAKLAQRGSAYTVTAVDAAADDTVNLIQEASQTYANYKTSLINTDDLASDLKDDGEAAAYISTRVEGAKIANLETRANLEKSVDSFNKRGISEVYTLTDADVSGGIDNDDAVAAYVADLLSGSAEVYISDVISVPALDDAAGTYTGNSTSMRYVYIKY